MVEAMADKADMRQLARKVSHDQFEMACDDLAKGIEHAVGKLNMQVNNTPIHVSYKIVRITSCLHTIFCAFTIHIVSVSTSTLIVRTSN